MGCDDALDAPAVRCVHEKCVIICNATQYNGIAGEAPDGLRRRARRLPRARGGGHVRGRAHGLLRQRLRHGLRGQEGRLLRPRGAGAGCGLPWAGR